MKRKLSFWTAFALFLNIFIVPAFAQADNFSVTGIGKIKYNFLTSKNSIKIAYNVAEAGARLIIKGQLPLALPADYSINWQVESSGGNILYRTYIEDSQGERWRGMKLFTISKKQKNALHFITKAHLLRPVENGQSAPSTVEFLQLSLLIEKKGKGEITFKDFTVEEIYLTAKKEIAPVMLTSIGEEIASLLYDGDDATRHTFQPGSNTLILDFHAPRSPGGIYIQTDTLSSPYSLKLYAEKKGRNKQIAAITGSNRERLFLQLTDHTASRYFLDTKSDSAITIEELQLMQGEVNDDSDLFAAAVSQSYPAGLYPSGYTTTPHAKTLLYENKNESVFINRVGQIEFSKGGFILDPFIRIADEIGTSQNAKIHVRYAPDSSRIYHSNRMYEFGELWVRAFCDTLNQIPYLNIIYEAANTFHFKIRGKLHIAVRPLRLTPYLADDVETHRLQHISNLEFKANSLSVNKKQLIHLFTESQTKGTYGFYQDDFLPAIFWKDNNLQLKVIDPAGMAAALLSYDFTLIPASRRLIFLSVPLGKEKTTNFNNDEMNLEGRMRPLLPQMNRK